MKDDKIIKMTRTDSNPAPGRASKAAMIATFDSGFGGYFTAQAINDEAAIFRKRDKLNIEVMHFGDTANAPYGNRDEDDIADLTIQGIRHIINEHHPKLVFIACNTASTQYDTIMGTLSEEFPDYENRIISIIEPTVQHIFDNVLTPAVAHDKQDIHFGLLATPATIRNGAYIKRITEQLGDTIEHIEHTELREQKTTAYQNANETVTDVSQTTTIRLKSGQDIHLHQVGPANWVNLIEHDANMKEKNEQVLQSMTQLRDMLPEGATLDGVGEFCTHYETFDNAIQMATSELGIQNNHTAFITQGGIMADLFVERVAKEKSSYPILNHTDKKEQPYVDALLTGDELETTQHLMQAIFPYGAGEARKISFTERENARRQSDQDIQGGKGDGSIRRY